MLAAAVAARGHWAEVQVLHHSEEGRRHHNLVEHNIEHTVVAATL